MNTFPMNLRNLLTAAALLLIVGAGAAYGQAMQGFNYQGIARGNAGEPLTNQNITLRLSLINAVNSTAEYVETHETMTNEFGLFTVRIGQGTPVTGTFAGVTWQTGSIQLKTEIDLGSGYNDLGQSPLMSVPYAIVAGNVVNPPDVALNDLTDVNTSGASNGQTLKWNGNNWVAGDDAAGFDLPYAGADQTLAETPLFSLTQTSEGPTAQFISSGTASTTSAVVVQKVGPGNGVDVTASGTLGSAGSFINNNLNNGAPTIRSINRGVGSAGYFQIINRNSDSAAVYARTDGTAAGVFGESTGNGRAYGVWGVANGDCVGDNTGLRTYCPVGVYGQSRTGAGVFGANSDEGPGVQGYSENGRIFEGQGPTENPGFPDMRFYVGNDGKLYAENGIYTPGVHSSTMNAMAELVTPGEAGVAPGDVLVVTAAGGFIESSEANQTTVIGIAVSNAAFLGGSELDADGNPVPSFADQVQVAMAGMVTINVNIENGSIAPGDLLVTSSSPGEAMKAGEEILPGTVVAKALEAFTGPDPGSIRAVVMMR